MVGGAAGLLVRWSWRDLRARWLQVAAIALIIALGSGFYSGLSSISTWRKTSYRESYEALRMFDLRLELAAGSFVRRGRLLEVVRSIPSSDAVAAAEERLIGPAQIDASTRTKTILVPGRIVGLDLSGGGPDVTGVAATRGRTLGPDDAGRPVAVLDTHFARYHGLPPTGALRLRGGKLEYVGVGLGPEYFIVVAEQGTLLAEANFAVVFASLETAQRLLDRGGLVNDLVLRLRPGARAETVRGEIAAAMESRLPDVGFELTRRADDPTHRLLYRDIDSDQRFYTVFALLILAGAAFAAFSLIGRMVEAQRREIGVGMALGAPPWLIAVRPLLVGAEVALLGVVFGVGVGLLVDSLVGGILRTFQPLPVWRTDFQPLLFLRGAALGLAIPFLASAYPVWRAVRVAPIEAIRTTALAARTSGIGLLLGRVPLPGSSFVQIPIRNVVRTPRRSVLTLLGIAASIGLMVGSIGMVDSFLRTIDVTEEEVGRTSPDRLFVGMEFAPIASPQVAAITGSKAVARASPGLELGGALLSRGTKIDVMLEVLDFDGGLWRPSVVAGSLRSATPSVVIAEKAARDLGVRPGDSLTLRHPRRSGLASYELVDSQVRVAGISPLPSRFTAFMDLRFAGLFGLEGIANRMSVAPAPGASADDVKRALFGLPGVTSVQPVSAFTDTIRKALNERLEVLYVIEVAVLVLVLLIAFNSTSINVDERGREHATMFAFGLEVRTVVAMAVAESVIVGLAGTLAGIGLGRLLLGWIVDSLVADVLPDIGVVTFVSGRTLATALALGLVAVAVAPLFVLRRLRRMDIPAALRVVE